MAQIKENSDFVTSLKTQLEGLTLAFQFLQILTSVILPIIEGFLVSVISNQDKWSSFHLLLILIAVIHLIIVLILLSIEKPLPKFLLEFEEKEKHIREQIKAISFYEKYSQIFIEAFIAIELSLISINQVVINKKEEKNIAKICEIILDPWIKSRSDIFNFLDGNAMYNVAVYSLKPESNLLELDFRKYDDRIKAINRKWKAGVGHVGQCFSTEQTIFCRDIEENIRTTNKESSRKEDKNYYRSIIAEPIKQNQKTIGVVVITSSMPDQFDEDTHTTIIRIIALLLEIGYSILKDYK